MTQRKITWEEFQQMTKEEQMELFEIPVVKRGRPMDMDSRSEQDRQDFCNHRDSYREESRERFNNHNQ